jgi:polyphenol oxidase
LREAAEPGRVAAVSAEFWTAPAGSLPDGVRFVMATRNGGVSEGPFATLNLGLRVGDKDDAVLENVRRVRDALGLAGDEPRRVRQVHGTAMVSAAGGGAANDVGASWAAADGFLVQGGDPWVAVSIADCAPVAIVSSDGSQGALLHSGWRGTADGIGVRAVEALRRRGVPPSELRVVVGPCIHACCYPVGSEVAARFPTSLLKPHRSGRFALDLPGAILDGLTGAGVPRHRAVAARECTACLPDGYFSHRRDSGRTGRHWAFLRLSAPGR